MLIRTGSLNLGPSLLSSGSGPNPAYRILSRRELEAAGNQDALAQNRAAMFRIDNNNLRGIIKDREDAVGDSK